VTLPDSGVLTTEITLPSSHVPRPGWSVLEVSLDGVKDSEPRDDSRQFVVDVSLEPAAVIFASPPDWEARFLARTLSDVARVPVKVFVETEPGRWRDGATLAPAATNVLTSAARRPAPDRHARGTQRRATGRHRQGGRPVALGVSRRRRAGGLSQRCGSTGGLALEGARSGEQGAGSSARSGGSERAADRLAV